MGLSNRKKKSFDLEEKQKVYNTKFDYNNYDIEDLKKELIIEEQVIISNIKRTQESLFKMAESLNKVHNKLSNRGNGTYMAWCQNLGITPNKSSDLLNAYKIFLETNKREAITLPVRVVRELSRGKLDNKEVLKVIESEKPSKELEEIKKSYLHCANNFVEEEKIKVEILEDTPNKILEKLNFIKKDIAERERNLKKLKVEAKSLEDQLENLKNLKLVD